MSEAGGLFRDELPGERELARYRDGELVLTDRRVLHRPRATIGTGIAAVRLPHVTAVAVTTGPRFQPRLFLVPGAILFVGPVVLGALLGTASMLFGGLFHVQAASWRWLVPFAALALPAMVVPWLGRPETSIRIAAWDYPIRMRVPRAELEEAKAFVSQVAAAAHRSARNGKGRGAALP